MSFNKTAHLCLIVLLGLFCHKVDAMYGREFWDWPSFKRYWNNIKHWKYDPDWPYRSYSEQKKEKREYYEWSKGQYETAQKRKLDA